ADLARQALAHRPARERVLLRLHGEHRADGRDRVGGRTLGEQRVPHALLCQLGPALLHATASYAAARPRGLQLTSRQALSSLRRGEWRAGTRGPRVGGGTGLELVSRGGGMLDGRDRADAAPLARRRTAGACLHARGRPPALRRGGGPAAPG